MTQCSMSKEARWPPTEHSDFGHSSLIRISGFVIGLNFGHSSLIRISGFGIDSDFGIRHWFEFRAVVMDSDFRFRHFPTARPFKRMNIHADPSFSSPGAPHDLRRRARHAVYAESLAGGG